MPRTLVLLAGLLALSACEFDTRPPPSARPPAVRPDPPHLPCAVGGPARSFPGSSPALTSNAVVVHGARDETVLHRLDEPSAPLPLPVSVLALEWRGGTWLVVAPGLVGEIDDTGTLLWQLEIDVSAVDAEMSIDGDVAWVVLRDDEDEVSVVRVDLRARSADAAASVGRGRGRLLVGPGRAALAAAGALVWTPEGTLATPSSPIALFDGAVIFESDSSTGLWLGDRPVRLTRADVTPAAVLVTRLGERVALAYREQGDLFVQVADASEGALGQPVLVAPDASPAAMATSGERFWVAWERDGAVEVRAGECDGG